MIIADTSVWIEFFRKHDPVHSHFRLLLENRMVLAIEPVFGELLQGVKENREKNIILQYWDNLPKVEEKNLWLGAGILSADEKLLSKGIGLIDAFIIQSARSGNYKLWTLDKKIIRVLKKKETYGV